MSPRVRLGQSPLEVAPLGVGCWAWGDRRYWRYEEDLSPRDVVDAFGPPDAIRWSAGRLLFVYRAERRAVSSFVLSYYLNIFSAEIGRQEDGTLIVAFDDRDRLLYYGQSAEPREDLAGDLGVR